MGLDTSHDCWSGSYSNFDNFRQAIALAAGLPFSDGRYEIPAQYRNECYLYGYHGRSGDPTPEDVIWVLLAHSDCEGRISHRFCKPLAERLEALTVSEPYEKRLALFVAGLRDACESHEDVMFW